MLEPLFLSAVLNVFQKHFLVDFILGSWTWTLVFFQWKTALKQPHCLMQQLCSCNVQLWCRWSSTASVLKLSFLPPAETSPMTSLNVSYPLYSGFFFPNIKSIVSAWPNSLRISNSMTLFFLMMTMYFESLFLHFLFILFCPSFVESVFSSNSITVDVIVRSYKTSKIYSSM